MQSYYEVLKTIKGILEKNKLVNTVTQGDIASIDLDKKNIYPLTHIQTGTATMGMQVITFSITVFAMDIRDKVNAPNEDKFVGNDNELDNMNTMLAVQNDLFKQLANLDNGIAINQNPTCEPFYESRMNLLDGWAMTFEIDIPNTEISTC